jgi:hypothetical protein
MTFTEPLWPPTQAAAAEHSPASGDAADMLSEETYTSRNRAIRAMLVRSVASGLGDADYFCHYFLFICTSYYLHLTVHMQ